MAIEPAATRTNRTRLSEASPSVPFAECSAGDLRWPGLPGWLDQWPTVFLALASHGLWWWLVTTAPAHVGEISACLLLILVLVLYSSLQHEMLHGHPFRSCAANHALVWPAYGLLIPYQRFRTLHLAHHHDERLTDPYDDPESHFLDPQRWQALTPLARLLWSANNTLAGRMLIGPFLGTGQFLIGELQLLAEGDVACRRAWQHHLLALLPVVVVMSLPGGVSVVAYLLAVLGSLSVLRIRTFLEHRAHASAPARTVIIDSRGPLAWLFLFNNFHAVHHAHPRMPWYRLPSFYTRHATRVMQRNDHYWYQSYAEVLRRYLLVAKDPVAHPLYSRGAVDAGDARSDMTGATQAAGIVVERSLHNPTSPVCIGLANAGVCSVAVQHPESSRAIRADADARAGPARGSGHPR